VSGATGATGGAGMTGGAHGSSDLSSPQGHSGPQEGGYTVTDTRPPTPPHQPPSAYVPPSAGVGPSSSPAAAGVRKPRPAARTGPRTRKARLRISKADPWSVMKISFLLSIALGICSVIAVAVLWMVLDSIGVFSTVGDTISQATTSQQGGQGGFDLVSFLSLSRVLTFTTIIAVIDVVLATALATLGAFIYNLSAAFVGGVELTLAEDE
jgi:hypothetical protein